MVWSRSKVMATIVVAGVCSGASAFPIGDPNPPKPVLEYFNHYTRHYVLLSDPAEIGGVEAGAAGPGWIFTGYSFSARNETLSPPNICRFYAPAPTNSHFFTGNAGECAALKNNSGWIYENLDFSIELPQGDGCAANLVPIYRLYNNRWMLGDSNHRFVHDASTRDDMIAAGWRDEGIAFCATSAGRADRKTFHLTAGQVRPSAECENEAINLGSCVALNQLPPLANRIVSWLPPFYVTQDSRYLPRFTQLTGFDGDVFTAQPVADSGAVARHSFAQTLPIAIFHFGMHVSYLDRTRGDLASINPLYQFRTTGPVANGPDERLFPWLYPVENEIVVSFHIDVRTVRRLNADSHAYGHPTLQFMDTTSGQHLYVTLGTFGTGVPGRPGDLLGMDDTTGRVIVGTAFRDDPLFGKRLAGSFMHCEGDVDQGGCGTPSKGFFSFRITRDDFAKVLRLARTLNPGLSDDPMRYLLANFHFNNEIYREAELGLTLSDYTLRVFGY